MNQDAVHLALSRVVHELWRRKLIDEGWKAGAFDPGTKHHDALIPYEQLSRGDRLALSLHVQTEEFERKLPALLRYSRGPDRPLLIEEMRVGLPVVFCERGCPEHLTDVPMESRGTITSWETDPGGELSLVTVRWNSGEECEYGAWSGELARAEELS